MNLFSKGVATLFLDTNFLRQFIGKACTPASHAAVMESLRHETAATEGKVEHWRSPLAVLEWIGVPREDYRTPALTLPAPCSEADIRNAFDRAVADFAARPGLQFAALRAKYIKQTCYVRPRARELWDAVTGGIFDRDFGAWMHYALAFDAVHKIPTPPADLSLSYYTSLARFGFFATQNWVRNVSKYRLGVRLLLALAKKIPPAKRIQSFVAIANVDDKKDLLDCDLVHLATIGVETRGVRLPIVAFTCDDSDTISARIRTYKGLAKWARDTFPQDAEPLGIPSDFWQDTNGAVHCFNPKTGQLIRRIDVRTDTDPLPFLLPCP